MTDPVIGRIEFDKQGIGYFRQLPRTSQKVSCARIACKFYRNTRCALDLVELDDFGKCRGFCWRDAQ